MEVVDAKWGYLSVRDASAADKLSVARVHVRSWQVAYRGIFSDDYLDHLNPEERAERYTFGSEDPRGPQTIVITHDSIIFGFASFGPSRDEDVPTAGEIYAIYLDPSSWHRGAGQLLMASALSRLREVRFREALLWVLERNERARRFYEMDGWSPDGEVRTEDVWGVQADEVRYRRRLH